MGKKKFIDKKRAITFRLVDRPRSDAAYLDTEASQQILVPSDLPLVDPATARKVRREKNKIYDKLQLLDPEDKDENVQKEREALQRRAMAIDAGIFFPDSIEYDYSQHLRDVDDNGNSMVLNANGSKNINFNSSSKDIIRSGDGDKVKYDSVMRRVEEVTKLELKGLINSLAPILPTRTLDYDYQSQQNIPDELAGFQPDMDPSLREILDALDDDAYVVETMEFNAAKDIETNGKEIVLSDLQFESNQNDDMFDELLNSGPTDSRMIAQIIDDDRRLTFEQLAEKENHYIQNNDSYDSDQNLSSYDAFMEQNQFNNANIIEEINENESQQIKQLNIDADLASEAEDQVPDLMTQIRNMKLNSNINNSIKNNEKFKSGPKSVATGFSMSSSALFRKDTLTLLDERFDKVEEEYNKMSDDEISDPGEVKGGLDYDNKMFNDALDEFLDTYEVAGKRGRVIKK